MTLGWNQYDENDGDGGVMPMQTPLVCRGRDAGAETYIHESFSGSDLDEAAELTSEARGLLRDYHTPPDWVIEIMAKRIRAAKNLKWGWTDENLGKEQPDVDRTV